MLSLAGMCDEAGVSVSTKHPPQHSGWVSAKALLDTHLLQAELHVRWAVAQCITNEQVDLLCVRLSVGGEQAAGVRVGTERRRRGAQCPHARGNFRCGRLGTRTPQHPTRATSSWKGLMMMMMVQGTVQVRGRTRSRTHAHAHTCTRTATRGFFLEGSVASGRK
jgi:hypothetical protein